jgi:hypothetical protein
MASQVPRGVHIASPGILIRYGNELGHIRGALPEATERDATARRCCRHKTALRAVRRYDVPPSLFASPAAQLSARQSLELERGYGQSIARCAAEFRPGLGALWVDTVDKVPKCLLAISSKETKLSYAHQLIRHPGRCRSLL